MTIAARHGGGNGRVFGSRARGEARPDSDLDLPVDMQPGRSLLDLAHIKVEIEERLGRTVDTQVEGGLSRHFREAVLHSSLAL